MTVPDSFGAWENQETRRYCNHVENYLLPLGDKLAELNENWSAAPSLMKRTSCCLRWRRPEPMATWNVSKWRPPSKRLIAPRG